MTPNPSDAAREALELIGRALPADGRVELALAAGHLPERTATARIIVADRRAGPPAVATFR